MTVTFSTPDLCDEFHSQLQVLEPLFQSFGGQSRFAGPIQTVKCFEDNSLVKDLANQDNPGGILVVDGGGSLRRALLGDLIAQAFVDQKWAGILINGCVRDVEILKTLPFGVKALNSIPVKTEKRGLGDLNVPVRFAGVDFKPGQWLYSDETGIVVSDTRLIN